MSDELEAVFFELPSDVRLTIVSALQAVVANPGPFASAGDAADALARIGFPESAAAARQVAARRDT